MSNASIAYLTSENLTSLTIQLTNHTGGSIGMKMAAPVTLQSMINLGLNLPDTQECINSTILALSGGIPAGGTYSGTGVSGTNFNASLAGLGVHAITYTYTDSNGCVSSVFDNIVVTNCCEAKAPVLSKN